MGAKHRYIDRTDWKRPLERVGRAKNGPDGSFAFRTDLLRLSSPVYGEAQTGERAKIADDGWTWLSWMRPDFPWALTAMRDEHGEWVQFYFDIVSAMGCDADGRAWFDDCWLDLVVFADGRAFLLDEDELQQALDRGEVSADAAENARRAAEELLRAFPEGAGRLREFMERLYADIEQSGRPYRFDKN